MKKFNIFKIVILVLCFFALIGLFLPYEKSIGEYRQSLKDNPTIMNVEEVNLKNKDVVDISIIENFKVYSYAMNNSSGDDWMQGEATINVIITITLILSIVLLILFTLLNKSVLAIIFSIIMGISSLLMNYDIVDRGVIPSSKYTYGLTYYLYIILTIIILVCSIINIINNKKKKKNSVN
jgi:glucan phosphoethanolaminetransferase (alkaline phosphatase superfamily)